MNTMTFTDARKHFAETMQKVSDNAEPVRIIRRNRRNVVIIDAEEYDAMIETLYLFGNPNNADHINKSLKEFENGKVIDIDI